MKKRNSFPSIFTILLSSAALAFGVGACSSDDDDKGGGPGGSGNGGGQYTLDNLCEQAAAKQCTDIKACCDSTGVGYDEGGCLEAARKDCDRQVALVKAGKRTFDSNAVNGCLAGMKAAFDKCEMTLSEATGLEDLVAACDRVFVGTVEAGGACEHDEDCKPASEDNEYAICDEGTCAYLITSLGEGADCDDMRQCAEGLYCAPGDMAGPAPGAGLCEKRKAIGEACEQSFFSAACVEGSYCDVQTSQCVAMKSVGAECTVLFECDSLKCEEGKCAEPEKYSMADAESCKGEAEED